MTDAFSGTRKSSDSARSWKTGAGANTASSPDPLAVLLRLPDLNRGDRVRHGEELPFETADPPEARPTVEPVIAEGPVMAAADAAEPQPESEQQPTAPEKSKPATNPVSARFHAPRWAIQGVAAVSLLLMLVIAYVLIFSGDESSKDIAAEDGSQFESAEPLARMSMPPSEPALPFDIMPQLPEVKQPAKAKPQPESPPAAREQTETIKQTEAFDQAEQTFATASENGANSPIENEPADGAASEFETVDPLVNSAAPNAEIANVDDSRDLDQDANGMTQTVSAEAPAGTATSPAYPVTDPATFQYPPGYQDNLRHPGTSNVMPSTTPWPSDQRDPNWQPTTARLQPRIEPPPVR